MSILQSYVTLACQTESRIENIYVDTRLFHGVLGVCTEIGELVISTDSINLIEEIGDISWYLAIISDVQGYNFGNLINRFTSDGFNKTNQQIINKLVADSLDLLDKFKKAIYYNAAIGNIDKLVENIFEGLAYLCINNGINIEEMLELNIKKLQDKKKGRYKNQVFNSDEAINRDVDNERQLLETSNI
jgi:hypothetical protein